MKPIHFASILGNINTFKILIKLGSDPRSPRQNVVRNLCLCLVTMQLHTIAAATYIRIYLLLYSLEDSPFIMHVLKVMCHW